MSKSKGCTNCPYKMMAEFKPPTIQELKEFAKEMGWDGFNAEDFLDRHSRVGWMDCHNRLIRDWKAEMRIWFRASIKRGEIKPNTNEKTFRERNEEDKQQH